jgi:hypothetical protein
LFKTDTSSIFLPQQKTIYFFLRKKVQLYSHLQRPFPEIEPENLGSPAYARQKCPPTSHRLRLKPKTPSVGSHTSSVLHYYLTTPPSSLHSHFSFSYTLRLSILQAASARARPPTHPPPTHPAALRPFVGERVGVAARFVFTTTPNVAVVVVVLLLLLPGRGFWARFSFHGWVGVSRFTDRRSSPGSVRRSPAAAPRSSPRALCNL